MFDICTYCVIITHIKISISSNNCESCLCVCMWKEHLRSTLGKCQAHSIVVLAVITMFIQHFLNRVHFEKNFPISLTSSL